MNSNTLEVWITVLDVLQLSIRFEKGGKRWVEIRDLNQESRKLVVSDLYLGMFKMGSDRVIERRIAQNRERLMGGRIEI